MRLAILPLLIYLALCCQAYGQASARLIQDYGKLPLGFESNTGQADQSVKFLSRGRGYGLYLTGNETVLALRGGGCAGPVVACSHQTAVVRMQVAGTRSGAANPTGEEQLPGAANYLIGDDPGQWRTGVPTYAKVRYGGVYPGIDLVYYGSQGRLEYDFVAAPGSDPKSIRLRFAGAKRLRLSADGDLVVTVVGGAIAFHKPVVYQVANGQRKPVEGAFALLARHTVGFRLGSYDHTNPLVIDPALVYATYIGGTASDAGDAIAADAEGNVYIAGATSSVDFPVTQGALQNKTQTPNETAFVAKLNPAGTALLYSTYLGGSGGDAAYALAIDSAGNAYLAGATQSSDFPVTNGAFLTAKPGTQSAFVAKLNPTGSALAYATYLGGSDQTYLGGDSAGALAVDRAGNAYIAGVTYSSDFPVTSGAFQTQNKSELLSGNAFVAKLNPAGTALVYSTYLGGSGICEFSFGPAVFVGDYATGLSVDSAGNAYVAGSTYSADFPVTAGAFQTKNRAFHYDYDGELCPEVPGSNAFLTKLNETGTALVYSTYLGGSGGASLSGDRGSALSVDASGNSYLTGATSSTDFPVTPGAYQTTSTAASNFDNNAFVTKLDPAGSGLIYSTYLGGTGGESGKALAVDGAGNVYIAGAVNSADFPVTQGALQPTNHSTAGSNGFFTVLNPTGSALAYSTYLGGSGSDSAAGLVLDNSGNAYIAGTASSADFPVTPGAFQTSNRSTDQGSNAFVAKFSLTAATPPQSISATNVASFTGLISPGSLVALFGNGNILADDTVPGFDTPLPESGGGTSVSINGIACRLLYVSPTQINLQAPAELAPGLGAVVVNHSGTILSAPVHVLTAAPGILTSDYRVTAILQDVNGVLLDANNPARPGQTVVMYLTGVGPVTNYPGDGEPAPLAPLARSTSTYSITVNGIPAHIDYLGLTPELVGVAQVDFEIPVGTPTGNTIPVALTIAGTASKTVQISVQAATTQ